MQNPGSPSKFQHLEWFDAHLDLAYLAECGRDMDAPLDSCGGPGLPAAVTLRTLREGRVHAFMGTIFTEADGTDAVGYPAGDAAAAHAAGARQLGWYRRWAADGKMEIRKAPRARGIEAPSGGRGAAVYILMECADPIRAVEELDWWVEQGVRAIGLAWARGSRYAGGNTQSGAGLTGEGRRLIQRMHELGVVHDLAHLSQRATDEALDLPGRVIASHSNCRALLDEKNERHVTDETIRAIGARGGVVGLNLCRNFIRKGLDRSDRPTLAEAVRHVDRAAQLVGHARAVGLGSDMDGGFSAEDLPLGISSPSNLDRLAEALAGAGWSDGDIAGFAWGNWARFWGMEPGPA